MPTHRVTPAAIEVIRRGKAAGKSSRDIADILRDQLGIELDQRTVSRQAKIILEGRASKVRPPTPSPVEHGEVVNPNRPRVDRRAKAEREPDPDFDLNEGVTDLAPTLNETAALEREALRLQNLLATDIPNRDRVAILAELRQSLRSIRLANAASKKGLIAEDRELAEMRAKLKRFAFRNVKDFGETEETNGVPEVSRATSSG